MEQDVATQVIGLGGSTDFSLIQLFLRADFIVKSVIIILIAASVYSWALIFDKDHPVLSRTLENIIKAVHEKKYKFDHHSLTVKTYATAIFDLSNESNAKVSWDDISEDTDDTYDLNTSSFRMYGVDYNNFFKFQHKYNHELRGRKKGEISKNHWTEEQKTKSVY